MKKKMTVVVGIVVCVMLLASPALATAGYTKIYGNANEDDVLDMRDVTYIKLVIFGKKPVTTLADANYDGKVSMLDVGQTKLIILDKEKKLTLIDNADRVVTVPRPIERIVSAPPDATRLIVALDEWNKLVGISRCGSMCLCYNSPEVAPICAAEVCGGMLFELPVVGHPWATINNVELTLSLEPDVIFDFGAYTDAANTLQEQTGVPVVCIKSSGHKFETVYEAAELVGTILKKEEEAQEVISLVKEKIDKVREVTSEIPDDEKPTVYFATRGADRVTRTIDFYEPLNIAGGINVAKDLLPSAGGSGTTLVDVSKEQIIAWNPDIIIVSHSYSKPLDEVNDVEMILSDPDLQTVDAVKNHRVYFSMYSYCCGRPQDRNLANMMYLAKLFHPEEFEDLDVEEEGNEIYEGFLGVGGLFSEYADATIWIREWLDSQ